MKTARPFGAPRASTALLLACMGCHNAAGDSAPDASEAGGSDRLNVLVVLVDTLRADHMSVYGYERETTPFLEIWQNDGVVVFENSVAQNYWTAPSISSLYTGLLTPSHQCCQTDEYVDGQSELSERFVTLAEHFADQGYRTLSAHASGVYDVYPGIDRGFEIFEDHTPSGDPDVQWVMDQFDSEDERPFFAVLHYMTPHSPYTPHEPWDSMFTEGVDSDIDATDANLHDWNLGVSSPTAADIERVVGLYDGEIAWFDSKFQQLWQALLERGLHDETVILLVGDHGEQLGDHGGWSHTSLWQENLMVPTMLRYPQSAPTRRAERIQTIDLPPTLATLVGIEPLEHWQGRDLTLLRQPDGAFEPTPILSGSGGRYALFSPDNWKFSYDFIHGDTALYDLNSDPGEEIDLSNDDPERTAEILEELLSLHDAAEAFGDSLLE